MAEDAVGGRMAQPQGAIHEWFESARTYHERTGGCKLSLRFVTPGDFLYASFYEFHLVVGSRCTDFF